MPARSGTEDQTTAVAGINVSLTKDGRKVAGLGQSA